MTAFRQLLLRVTVLLVLMATTACTSYPPREAPPAPVEQRPQPTVVVPPVAKPPQPRPSRPAPAASAAWQPLLTRAEQAAQRGDYEEALALLERAQRIEPNSGEVYLCMARTLKAKGDLPQSRATAERGLLYCSTDAMCNALRGFTH